MECPSCGFIEQRDVRCPNCERVFNASDAEEWAHLDYLEAKLGAWRDQGLLSQSQADQLLERTDQDLAAVEHILGVVSDPSATPAANQDRLLDGVDEALARGDTDAAGQLLATASARAAAPDADDDDFEPVDTETGLDLLFLVSADHRPPPSGESFRRA